MRIFKSLAAAACAVMAAGLLLTAAPVQAQEPHYLRALADLRTARDYIQFDHRPYYQGQRDDAVREINKAIDEVKRAAWDDGKNTRFAPPSGVVDPWRPMHEAERALHEANENVKQGIDRPENGGLRERAIHHIEEAETIVSRILMDEHQRER